MNRKKNYIKPLLVSEEFSPSEYIAACPDTGDFIILPEKAPLDSDTKFYLDYNRDGIPNDEGLGKIPTNTSGSGSAGTGEGLENYWGWISDQHGNIQDLSTRYRLFSENGTIYWAYKSQWVSNKNLS